MHKLARIARDVGNETAPASFETLTHELLGTTLVLPRASRLIRSDCFCD
jgi:hypothetical protein